MKHSSNNPESNKLNQGISEADIEQAISKSGYPLQTIVSRKLNKTFHVKEEWSFLDPKTKEIRAIDILAEKWLYSLENGQPRARPHLNLLIECKQSELPYVFFLSDQKIESPNYPSIAGLFNNEIELKTDDTGSTFLHTISSILDMKEHAFLKKPPSSLTFSKCVRKGKNLVLSGTEGYQNLILPIISSLHDFQEAERPKDTTMWFDAHLTFGIGILDSPMIGVTVTEEGHEQELIPWVRVFRHESYESEEPRERKKVYAIDIIHKDFLDSFINNHLLPFATEFADKILKHDIVIATGKGFAKGLDKNSWENIESRLEKGKIRMVKGNPFKK